MPPIHEDATIEEVLEEAIGILQEKGWCQKAGTRDGRVCVSVAISRAVFGEGTEKDAGRNHVNTTLKKLCRGSANAVNAITGYSSIPVWNDLSGRTYEDVMLTMKKAKESVHAAS